MEIRAGKLRPKYQQLKEFLFRYFVDERYQANQKLPTEHAFMSKFNVSRGTIRHALAELEHEGVLYRIQGSGTFFSGKLFPASQKSHLIGVVTPSLSFYIYPQIIQGITDFVQQRDYHLLLGCSTTSLGLELGCIEQLLAKDIDGLIFEPAPGFQYAPNAELFRRLKSLDIPVVFMGAALDDADLSYVSVDDLEGGFRATEYLINAGHRLIACLYPPHVFAGQDRFRGYVNALNAYGLAQDERLVKTISTFYTNETPAQTIFLMKELLALGSERPTAVFCFNDLIAAQSYKAIKEARLRVPDDISLIGFDDSEMAIQLPVSLTSMIHPKYYLGKWAAELLLEMIAASECRFPRRLLITPIIAVRQSVKRLAQ